MAKAPTAKQKPKDTRIRPTTCPCGSRARYADCCGPLHEGTHAAESALQLVRARFSAYALGRVEFLWDSLHSGHDDRKLTREGYLDRVQQGLTSCRYRSLQILDTREPDEDGMVCVLFAATITQLNRDLSVVEQAYFVAEDDQWRYIAGDARPRAQLTHALKDMAIDHWQCDHHHHH